MRAWGGVPVAARDPRENYCVECGVPMGADNPHQLCAKLSCANNYWVEQAKRTRLENALEAQRQRDQQARAAVALRIVNVTRGVSLELRGSAATTVAASMLAHVPHWRWGSDEMRVEFGASTPAATAAAVDVSVAVSTSQTT